MDIRVERDLCIKKHENNTLTTGVFIQGMIYEDDFDRRLWKPKCAGVYVNIYRQELRCHSSAQSVFGISASHCRNE